MSIPYDSQRVAEHYITLHYTTMVFATYINIIMLSIIATYIHTGIQLKKAYVD